MIAEVIVDILNKQVNRSFDYLVPSHLESIIKVGFRVNVPFGRIKRLRKQKNQDIKKQNK